MTLVRRFHEKFDQDRPSAPQVPRPELAALRIRLIKEEFNELDAEFQVLLRMLRSKTATKDQIVTVMQALVKETCDLIYVAEGTLVAFGSDDGPFEEVHRSNMTKTPGRTSASKAIKGPNYIDVDYEKMFPSIIDIPEEDISEYHGTT